MVHAVARLASVVLLHRLKGRGLSDAVTSRHVKRRGLLTGAWFALLIAGAARSAYAADYTPVTGARLANPEPGNWLMTRSGYRGWSYRRAEHFGHEDR